MFVFFRKPYRWAILWAVVLALSFAYTLLDAFVIPREQDVPVLDEPAPVAPQSQPPAEKRSGERPGREKKAGDSASGGTEREGPSQLAQADVETQPVSTEDTYRDDNISITLETARVCGTTYYLADIRLTSAQYLRTAFAQGTFGRNIKETTSGTAAANDAILAINGDFYGFRDSGLVARNGVWYRDGVTQDSLLIDAAGNFMIVDDQQALGAGTPWQAFSFGPTLVDGGRVVVDESSEVAKSRGSGNPRTAIGQVSDLHYVFLVSDGRTRESSGLSLLDLAEILLESGCQTAYNLDGGGSSTLYFNGRVINRPTTNGRTIQEREVSDIVYIGYGPQGR